MKMRFSRQEIKELFIAWIILTIILSHFKLALFPVSFAAVGTAFVCHELAHKYYAQKYNMFAEFKLWKEGLALAMLLAVMTKGNFVFAAPGAVYIYGSYITKEQNGKISLAGPFLNLIIATISLFIYVTISKSVLFSSLVVINGYLGFFNLLPIAPLDGSKILQWDKNKYFIALACAFMIILFIEYNIF